jgi:hypothetical protein
MISRISSGSRRADSAVEPIKSGNITVTGRRSARSSGEMLVAPEVAAISAEGARIGAQRGNSFQEDTAVADRANTDLLQVLLREPTCSFISCSRNAVLLEAEPAQPTSDIHGGALPFLVMYVREAPRGGSLAIPNIFLVPKVAN